MRKSADSAVLKFLFVAIVLVFMFWGVGSMRASRMEVAARVNDEVVTQRQFEDAYKRFAAMYQNAGQQAPPVEYLRGQTLDQLIDAELLVQEADHLGLTVDEDELREAIASAPEFQTNGHFDKELYLRLLQSNGYKPNDFEELQRRRLLANKVQELVRSGVHVSDNQLKERFHYENERLNLRFVRIPAAPLQSQVTLTDEDLQKYFADNQEQYREPERTRIKLIEFRPEAFAEQITPTDAEVQTYFDAHAEDYHRPEELRARHILIKVAPDATEEDKKVARQRAEAVLAKAKEGSDFAELAKQYSQDTTAPSGGDLGQFGRGVMTPAFEQAAFALEPGQVSAIVETPFGLHIIKLEEKLPDRRQPLEEVHDAIVSSLKMQQARAIALKKVEEAHEKLLDGKDFAQVAADAGLKVQTPAPFARNEPIGAAFGVRPELAKEAFATEPGEIGEIVTEPNGYDLIAVEERIPSAIPELAAVRPRVEADLRRRRGSEEAGKRAEALLAKLKETPDLEAVAQQEGVKVEESTQVGRFGPFIPNLGNSAELKDAVFRLTPEAPVVTKPYDVGGDAVIAVLTAKLPPDEQQFESQKTALRDGVIQREETTAVRHFIDQLKAKANIQLGHAFGGATSSSE
jgi:peptidyl-prolyl cis-trans isomerase D